MQSLQGRISVTANQNKIKKEKKNGERDTHNNFKTIESYRKPQQSGFDCVPAIASSIHNQNVTQIRVVQPVEKCTYDIQLGR